jgi:mannose-6-phosphate isomerase
MRHVRKKNPQGRGMTLYPLKFYEIYKPKVWGGKAIAVLGKTLPSDDIGESWDLTDHFDDVSVVRNGPLEGRSLREVWREDPVGILGGELAERGFGEFPLLVKFIGASAWLSVQVHPDEEYAVESDPGGESAKNEVWVVLSAEPGARLVAGVHEGTTKESLRGALDDGSLEKSLAYVDVTAGDVVHVAAGTVHSLGPGLVIAEIQQSSDATYRIWDWERVGDDGKPRPLHVEHAINVIDFDRGPVGTVEPRVVDDGPCRREILDECEHFVIERVSAEESFEPVLPGDRFSILVCIEGEGGIVAGGRRWSYSPGDTILLPAALGAVSVDTGGKSVFLVAYIPKGASIGG